MERAAGHATIAAVWVGTARERLRGWLAAPPAGTAPDRTRQVRQRYVQALCVTEQDLEDLGDPPTADRWFSEALAQAQQRNPATVRAVAQHYGDLLPGRGEAARLAPIIGWPCCPMPPQNWRRLKPYGRAHDHA
ncbi:MAG: hypothetical protein M3Z04_09815 [Chloroflexota bacterium]|nr:hypothetical protein [Chloroflexota bacterium]